MDDNDTQEPSKDSIQENNNNSNTARLNNVLLLLWKFIKEGDFASVADIFESGIVRSRHHRAHSDIIPSRGMIESLN